MGQVDERDEDAGTDQSQDDQPAAEELPPVPAVLLEEAKPATVDRRADLALAFGVLALGLTVVYLSRGIKHGVLQDPIGPAGFASFLGGLIAVLGLILVVRRLITWRKAVDGRVYADGGEGDEQGLPASGIRPFILLAVGFGWDFMLPRIGFITATWLACLIAMLAMRTRSWVKLVVIPICFSLFTWVLFTRLSGLRFPAGPVDLFFATLIPRMN